VIGAITAGCLSPTFPGLQPVTGMSVWYDASDATTFTYSSSNIISQWSDKSGNSRNATQATTSQQPTRQTNVINGLPVVRFDGSNDYLEFTNILSGDTTFTVFWVLRPVAVTTGYKPSFAFLSNAPDVDYGALHYINPSAQGASYPFGGNSGWGNYDNSGSYTANSVYLMEFIADGSTWKVFKAGTQEGTNNTGGSPSYAKTWIAAQNNPPRFSQFDFGEILVYNTALSAGDVTTNRNYLNAKWGL
jgi:hypothetical protein